MDCEKFESTVLDELYGELDEVTSAAAKRHVAGCARCASVLSGLRATRRLAALPVVAPPVDLEERILAAAKEAQKVVPIGRKMSNLVSLAGSWAMRPQTAMAGLFLLMIGSSALFLGRTSHAPSSMHVSEQGEPVASVMTETVDRPPADKGGIAGDTNAKTVAAAPAPMATVAPPAAAASAANGAGSLDSLGGFASRAVPRGKDSESDGVRVDLPGAGARGGGGAGLASGPPAAHYGTGNAYSTPAAAPASPPPPPVNAPAAQAAPAPAQAQQAPSDFDDAMNAYNGGDYATATQLFDVVAKRGDLNAALWEARSVHRVSGAAAAAPMFDRVAQQAGASAVGYDATFDAARCYRELGQLDAARQRLNQLLLVPSYINRAQAELSAMNPKAAAKARAAQPPAAAPSPQASGPGAD